jgi:hypothetical protein
MLSLGLRVNNIITDGEIIQAVNEITQVIGSRYKPTVTAMLKKKVVTRKRNAANRLAKRIMKLAKGDTSESDKIKDMMNAIYKIAKENLPKRVPVPKDPMDMIVQTFTYYREYQKMWMGAESNIIKNFKNNVEELELLQQFFNRPIDDIITNAQLEKVIRKGIKDNQLNIENIVRKHYTEQSYLMSSLADEMINKAGLKNEDAIRLASMIEDRFIELSKDKKEQILNRLFSNVKTKERKSLITRILELSNLGAFSDEKYKQVICDHIGIPTLTPETAMVVSKLCDKIQLAEYKVLKGDDKYEIRWTTTYKYQLLQKTNDELQEIGRYNTLDEAKDHVKDIKWAEYPVTVGREYKDQLVMELNFLLMSMYKPTFLRKISTVQTLGMLLNARTLARNIVGNEMAWWAERTAHLLAIPIDWTRSKITGEDRQITFSPSNSFSSYIDGFIFGVNAAKKGWTPKGLEGRYELGHSVTFRGEKGLVSKIFKQLETTMRIALLSTDQAAYTRAMNKFMYEQSRLMCINNKEKATKENIKKYIEIMYDNLNEQANEYGKRMTYQNETKLTKDLALFKRRINLNKDWGLGDVIIKFTKVPANLLTMAIDFSPFGLMRGIYIMNKHKIFDGGEADPRTAELALSRALVGTIGFTGFGFWMAMVGIMTGDEDENEKTRMTKRSMGGGAYRFNVTAMKRYVNSGFDENKATWKIGDTVVSYDWMEPMATSISMGVAIAEEIVKAENSEDKPNFLDLSLSAIEGGLGTIFNLSMMRGFTSLFETPPGERLEGKDIASNIITKTIINTPASFIPTLSGQIRAYKDDYRRQTYSEDPTTMALNKIKDKLPGVSKTLLPQVDYLGKPIEKSKGEDTLFSAFISPAYVNKFTTSDESQEVIYQLYTETKNPEVLPGSMNRTFSINNEVYRLDDQQMLAMMENRGKEIDKLISQNKIRLLNEDVSIEQRVKLIDKIYTKAGDTARTKMRNKLKKGF